MNKVKLFLVAVLMLCLLSATVNAAIPVASEIDSGGWFNAYTGAYVVNPAHIDTANTHSCSDAFWLTGAADGGLTIVNEQWIVLDLGSEKNITALEIWNYYEGSSWTQDYGYIPPLDTSVRGVQDYTLWVGGEGTVLPAPLAQLVNPFSPMDGWSQMSSGVLAKAPAGYIWDEGTQRWVDPGRIGPTDVLNIACTARYIGLEVGSNWAGNSAAADFAGLDHMQVIPEPATLALFGLGGIAALRRRRA